MLPVRARAYKIFDRILLGLNGLILSLYFGLLYTPWFSASLTGVSIYTSIVALFHLIYGLTIYGFFRRRSIIGASLIGSSLFSINLVLLMLATGGFTSPYFGLWLLLVLAVGIYRPAVTMGLLSLMSLYWANQLVGAPNFSEFVNQTFVTLLSAYATGTLGFWLWHSHHTNLKESETSGQLSQQLSTEQLKSEIVLRHIGDGVVLIDTAKKIQLINPAAEKLTGWSETEAKEIDYHLVMPLSDDHDNPLTAQNDPISQVISKKQNLLSNNVTLTKRSGKKLAISIMISPIFDNSGQVNATIAIFRDISQLKAADRQRNEFISTASHEMRTPVAAAEGYISLALNPKIAQVDDKARDYLLKAKAATHHLGKLFADLLSATRIDEGGLPSNPQIVELGNLIKQVLSELELKARAKKLKLSFGSTTHDPKAVEPLWYSYVDPERIREVLTNLVDNAIKFTPKGEVRVSLSGDDQKVVVDVHDSGLGIAKEDQAHLFEKFYRTTNPAARDMGGTGLGLYISRAIIEMYNGRMWVDSQPNEGSHFYFSLPRLDYQKAQTLLTKPTSAISIQPRR